MPVVRISDLSWGGEGISRIEGKVVFIPYGLPGEIVEVEVVRSKKNFSQGKLIRILEPSPDRVEPLCPFYQNCGGCQLQHLAFQRQIREKERLFKQALNHALKAEEILVHPSLLSPSGFGYRHRLQLKTAWENHRFKLGFFKAKSCQVVSINRCLLANKATNAVLEPLREKMQILGYEGWSPDIELQIFEDPHKGGIVFSSPYRIAPTRQIKVIKELREIPGLSYLVFRDTNPILESGGFHLFQKKDSPEYLLPVDPAGLSKDIRLSCFPGVFTQINLELNRRLISWLVCLNLFDPQDTVLDLYCGLGNFSLPLALRVKEVIGLEVVPQAVANARWNQEINRISNCSFIEAQAEEAVHQLKMLDKTVSWVILDPPRTGAQELIPMFASGDLKGILYISCNPMTLFRDLALLASKGWKVKWSQPLDFFPQTFHLESVTLLTK
ncbi:MAG: class I SAM-dependent RNA methyltransferase [Deltaproteobacteria bacterium]|nr:class I SAM-dependent RNA methyltransferase [Deltaproteobacteria bacterium]